MEALVQTAVTRSCSSPGRVSTRPAQKEKSIGRAYWLAHCEGYRVDTAAGRLGFVEEIRTGRIPMLVIRTGRLGRRLLLVPADEVDFIVPRAQRIWLKSPVSIFGTEPAAEAGATTSRLSSRAAGGRVAE